MIFEYKIPIIWDIWDLKLYFCKILVRFTAFEFKKNDINYYSYLPSPLKAILKSI